MHLYEILEQARSLEQKANLLLPGEKGVISGNCASELLGGDGNVLFLDFHHGSCAINFCHTQ
jgi:prepilin-type processing-associated H-X9-DG protein